MELRHIRALVAVAEYQHFSRAAASLHISQPPLSAAVRELERELGVVLFERTTRSVRLTPEGRALLEPARHVLRAVADIYQVAEDSRSGSAGSVRAGFAGTSGYSVLADLVRAVRERAPRLQIELVPQVYSGAALDQVLAGQLDLAITGSPPPAALASLLLGDETLVLAVPDSHPLASLHAISASDLTGVPLVSYPREQDSWVRRATVSMLERAGVAPDFVAEAPDPFSLLALVAAGVAPAVVVDHRGRLHVQGVHYVRFVDLDAARFPLRLVWHATTASAATLRTVAVAREVFGDVAAHRSPGGTVQQQR